MKSSWLVIAAIALLGTLTIDPPAQAQQGPLQRPSDSRLQIQSKTRDLCFSSGEISTCIQSYACDGHQVGLIYKQGGFQASTVLIGYCRWSSVRRDDPKPCLNDIDDVSRACYNRARRELGLPPDLAMGRHSADVRRSISSGRTN